MLFRSIVCTWVLMAVLTLGSVFIMRRLKAGEDRSSWQNLLQIM